MKKSQRANNFERQVHISRNDKPSQRNGTQGSSPNNKKMQSQSPRKFNEDDIKPFRQSDKNKWKNNSFRRGKPDGELDVSIDLVI